MGEETTYGLSGAIDKRMARIQKTLKKKKSAVLEQRLKDLQALKDREAKALADARAAQALESQRRGRRPTAPLQEVEPEMIKETEAVDKLVDILTILEEDKVLVTVCNGKSNSSIYKT
jgi:hypothetical protein